MGKKIKLTERQVNMIQIANLIENNKGGKKKVKLTESQLARIVKYLKEGEMPKQSEAGKGMTKLFKSAVPKIKVEGEIPMGDHPLMPKGDRFKPQTEKQNQKTFQSFNEDEDKINNVIYDNLEQLLKDIAIAKYVKIGDIKIPSYLEDVGLNVEDLKTNGLIVFDNYGIIRVPRENWKLKVREIADDLRGNVINGKMKKDMSMEEDRIGPNITSIPDHDITPPEPEYGDEPEVETPETYHLRTIFVFKNELAILEDESGNLVFFNPSGSDEIETYDKDTIDYYVNSNYDSLSQGQGVNDWEDGVDLIKIDNPLASALSKHYYKYGKFKNQEEKMRLYHFLRGKLNKNPTMKEDGEGAIGGGAPMGAGAPMGGTSKGGGAGTMAKNSGPIEPPIGTVIKRKSFGIEKIEEMGDGGAALDVVTSLFGTPDPENMKHGRKPMTPGGKIVSKP